MKKAQSTNEAGSREEPRAGTRQGYDDVTHTSPQGAAPEGRSRFVESSLGPDGTFRGVDSTYAMQAIVNRSGDYLDWDNEVVICAGSADKVSGVGGSD